MKTQQPGAILNKHYNFKAHAFLHLYINIDMYINILRNYKSFYIIFSHNKMYMYMHVGMYNYITIYHNRFK